MPAGRNSKRSTTRPTTTRKQPRKAAAQLPGEKAVRQTTKTVPVASRKVSRAEKKPLAPEAIDRRKHFPETDRKPPRTAGGGTPRNVPPIPLS
jgi:hypothetical protein